MQLPVISPTRILHSILSYSVVTFQYYENKRTIITQTDMCTTQDLRTHFLPVSTLAIHNRTFKHSESQVTILMRQAYYRKTERQALFNSTSRFLIKSFNYCANSVYLQSWCRQCTDTVLCTSGKTYGLHNEPLQQLLNDSWHTFVDSRKLAVWPVKWLNLSPK